MAKMNVNLTLTKDYRKNDCLAPQKTNPKQSQFPKGQNERKIAYRKIRPNPDTASTALVLTKDAVESK
jgi:hypothetical protein